MNFGVAVFPGTWSERDCCQAVEAAGQQAALLWHAEADLRGSDCVILPGGFSYGDHLRCGAIARFSPLMSSVIEFAAGGGLVWGICNGFQILCEAGLLPGVLMRNRSLQFRCEPSFLRVEDAATPFTATIAPGEVLELPVSHGEGCYVADPGTLARLEGDHLVALRYVASDGGPVGGQSPNGSLNDIAGIVNETGNVLGMMPHPERACEMLLGSADGLRLFRAVASEVAKGAFA